MWGRIVSVLVSAGVVAGIGIIGAPAAQADTPGCVTRGEYTQIYQGMLRRHVHGVFDTRGWLLDGGIYSRGYSFCARAKGLAGTAAFTIVYDVHLRDGQVLSHRVAVKGTYCGDFHHRRRCF